MGRGARARLVPGSLTLGTWRMVGAGEVEIVRARAARQEKKVMVRMVAVCGVRRTGWGSCCQCGREGVIG